MVNIKFILHNYINMSFYKENFYSDSSNTQTSASTASATGTSIQGTATVNVTSFGKGLITFIFVWVFIGLVAFIMSLVCFGRSGSTFEKIMGLLLAIFFGPFYFLFYVFNGEYCR